MYRLSRSITCSVTGDSALIRDIDEEADELAHAFTCEKVGCIEFEPLTCNHFIEFLYAVVYIGLHGVISQLVSFNCEVLRVRLTVKMECPWAHHLKGLYRCETTILQCVPRKEAIGVSALAKVSINGDVSSEDLAISISKFSPSIENAKFNELRPGMYIGLVRTRNCPCASTILPFTNVLRGESLGEGKMRWTLLLESGEEVRRMLQSLKERGIEYQVEQIARVRGNFVLTAKQEQVLRAALEMGYFEIPKKANLSDLARLFNVSPRAINEVIRRTHKKLINLALEMGNANL